MDFSPDAEKLISGSSDNKIELWELCKDNDCPDCKTCNSQSCTC